MPAWAALQASELHDDRPGPDVLPDHPGGRHSQVTKHHPNQNGLQVTLFAGCMPRVGLTHSCPKISQIHTAMVMTQKNLMENLRRCFIMYRHKGNNFTYMYFD